MPAPAHVSASTVRRSRSFRIAAWLLMAALVVITGEGLAYAYLRVRFGPLYVLLKQHPTLGYFHVPAVQITHFFQEIGGTAKSVHPESGVKRVRL